LQATSFQVKEDQVLVANLGAKDPAASALSISVDSKPAHGALSGPDATGAFTYTPDKDFSGSDSFHVLVSDAGGLSTGASISITVQHVSNPPVTVADSARTTPGTAVTIAVLKNYSDPKNHPLTPKIASQSPDGTAVVNADGTITFTPAAGFAGTATIAYQDTNTEGDVSKSANIQVDVRPLQKVIYLTIAQQIFFDDTNSVTAITSPAGAGSPTQISLSRNGRTVLYGTSGQPGGVAWYTADLQGALSGQYVAGTGSGIGTGSVVLSDDGTLALYPVDQLSGVYVSTELFLKGLYLDINAKANAGTYDTEQVNDYYFANQDQSIFYISHAPANAASASTIYGATVASLGSAVQLSPVSADGDTINPPLRSTASGSQIVYSATRGSTLGVYEVDTTSPGSEVLLGPAGSNLIGQGLFITDFDIAPQGHFGAYGLQSAVSGIAEPAYEYLVDLDHPGSYTTIASFPSGTNLGAPLFSPDGQSALLKVSSSSGVALFEVNVAQPTALVQMSPTYPAASSISVAQYTPDGRNIVYASDAANVGSFDLYSIDRSKPGAAVQLNQKLGTSVYGPFISISADSTTIAYVQPETSGGTLSLFLVDRTTPGMPFKAADNIEPLQVGLQPFYIVP
jgi:hypothetical protein